MGDRVTGSQGGFEFSVNGVKKVTLYMVSGKKRDQNRRLWSGFCIQTSF